MNQPAPTSRPPASGTSVGRLLVMILILAAIGGGVYYYITTTEGEASVPKMNPLTTMKEYLAKLEKNQKLSPEYEDKDGDLLADAPADKAKFVAPAELLFTTVAADDPDKAEAMWKPFLDHLAKETGKKVTYLKNDPIIGVLKTGPSGVGPGMPADVAQKLAKEAEERGEIKEFLTPLRSADQQMASLKAGKLHITAFNTGSVTEAVNSSGFQPLYTLAAADGTFAYQMKVIVPAGSSVQKPEDLKGKAVALVTLSSNSGGRLPLAVFKEKFNLIPGTDYQFPFTGDHRRSIRDVAEKKYDAACVAGDLLDEMIAAGEIKADAVRVIYSSGNFCPLTFGVAHNLDPQLKAAVQKAFESFGFAGNSVGKQYDAQKRTKFVKIDYKKDFADVREVDGKLPGLLAAK